MPKISNKIDYSTTPISFYRFYCNDVSIQSSYVGHTANFRQRKNEHKACCNNPNSKKYNLKIYQIMRANGGWDNWTMIEIENKLCLSKRDAEKYERIHTEELNANMNTYRAIRTANDIKEINKKSYQKNKQERTQYAKQQYQNNSEKITCECGCVIVKQYLTEHIKTKKHITLMCVNT